MGLLSAGLLAALQVPGSRPFVALTLTLPDSTRSWSEGYVASATGGLYQGKILDAGEIVRSIAEPSYSLEHSDISVEVDDVDGAFGQLVDGSNANSIRGSVATLKLADLGVASSSWSTLFTGVVQRWEMRELGRWTLTLTQDDVPLRRAVPKVTIGYGDWPSAHEDAVGLVVPLPYGRHSSIGQGETGSLVLPYVDTSTYRFLVALGAVKNVDRVYVGGVEQSSGWTEETVTAGGRTYTVVTFTTTPFGEDGVEEVSADLQGYEDTGDGSGTMIAEPAAQLKHALINFVFGDYRSGNWATSHSRVDATSFTTASSFCSDKGYLTGIVIDERTTGADLITSWCQSLLGHAYWTVDGKVGVVFEDHRTRTWSSATLWRWDLHQIGGFSLTHEDRLATDAVTGTYAGERQTLLVEDRAITEDAPTAQQMRWSVDYVVAA